MHAMRERDEEKSTALKITNQFHSKGGMAYDLKCDGVRLTLQFSAKTRSEDPGEWRVEARGARMSEQAATVTEWGATRVGALEAVGRAWGEALETASMRVFDWAAVAKMLTAVRAL
jgi:hypothetical protein